MGNRDKKVDRFQPEDHRQVFTVMVWGKEGIFPDPGVLFSSIFSRSSNGQGQRRPRQLDSPIVMDPLLVAGWVFFFFCEGDRNNGTGTWDLKSLSLWCVRTGTFYVS